MDLSCQVGAVEGAGRVEAAREQRRGLLAVEWLQRDLGAAEQLRRLAGQAGERGLGELLWLFAAVQDEQDASPLERAAVGEGAEEAGVVERRRAQAGRMLGGAVCDQAGLRLQAGAFAADADLDAAAERVEEARKGGNEGCLFVCASQLEAGAVG
jgi:hypothetical protein